MLLPDVEYARPSSVQEALRLLDENDGARPLAGGQTILNVMKARAAAPAPGQLVMRRSIPAGKEDGWAAVTIGKDGTCSVNVAAALDGGWPRVVVGCVGAVPVLVRPDGAEEDAVRTAVRGANLQPPSDVHASAEYRRHLPEVLAARAIRQAQTRRN